MRVGESADQRGLVATGVGGGVTAVVSPISIPTEIVHFDIWIMVATALLLVVFATTGWRVNRWEGAALLACYAGYIAVQLSPSARAFLGIA